MRKNGQILLDDYISCNCGLIDLRTALFVVYPQYVGILGAVGVPLKGTTLWTSISRFYGNATAEVWSGRDLNFTGVR